MRIFIGCSYSANVPLKYRELSSSIASFLAKDKHKLVFGGGSSGMIEKCFMTFKYEGAKTKAILDVTDAKNLEFLEVDANEVTISTFRRTEEIFKSSEIILILPGGIGTLAELFSFIDAKRTKKVNIPIILYNYDHYYDNLLKFLKNAYEDSIISSKDIKLFDVVTDIKSLEKYIKSLEKEKESE